MYPVVFYAILTVGVLVIALTWDKFHSISADSSGISSRAFGITRRLEVKDIVRAELRIDTFGVQVLVIVSRPRYRSMVHPVSTDQDPRIVSGLYELLVEAHHRGAAIEPNLLDTLRSGRLGQSDGSVSPTISSVSTQGTLGQPKCS